MLDKMLGQLSDRIVSDYVKDYVSYYNEGDLDYQQAMPCLEVFCYYGKSLVERNYKELASLLQRYEVASVDYEHFGKLEGFSRIMIYLKQETPLYEAIVFAKVLSEYGCTEYGLINMEKGAK